MQIGNYLKDRLFYSSDEYLKKPEDRKNFERITIELFQHLDFEDFDVNRLVVSAHDFLEAKGLEREIIGLVLALFQSGVEIFKRMELIRGRVLQELKYELEDGDEEEKEEIEENIKILKESNYREIEALLNENVDEREIYERPITSFESAFIRDKLRESGRIKNGKGWSQFKKRISLTFGLSEQQIAAVKAWESSELKARGGKTIEQLILELKESFKEVADESEDFVEKEKISLEEVYDEYYSEHKAFLKELQPASFVLEKGKISREQRRWIYALMLLTEVGNRKKIRSLLAENFFGCSTGKIGAVTAYLTGGCREAAGPEIVEDIKITEDYINIKNEVMADEQKEKEIKETDESEENERENGREYYEFDNEKKNKWREELKNFVDQSTNVEQRRNLKVLCLPGKDCLEAKIYLDLGFSPENIVGYMRDDDPNAVNEFLKNANELGIEPRIADLKKVAKDDPQEYDVISLDFFGQLCPAYYEIRDKILPAAKVVFAINVMAKRESKRVLNTLDGMTHTAGEDVLFYNEMSDKDLRLEAIEEIRNFGIYQLLVGLGYSRKKKIENVVLIENLAKRMGLEVSSTPFNEIYSAVFKDLFMRLAAYLHATGLPKEEALKIINFFGAILPAVLENGLVIRDLQRWTYTNSNKAQYSSDFALMESVEPIIGKLQGVVEFCLAYVVARLANTKYEESKISETRYHMEFTDINDVSINFEDKHGNLAKAPFGKNDFIAVRDEKKRLIARIRPARLISEFEAGRKVMNLEENYSNARFVHLERQEIKS